MQSSRFYTNNLSNKCTVKGQLHRYILYPLPQPTTSPNLSRTFHGSSEQQLNRDALIGTAGTSDEVIKQHRESATRGSLPCTWWVSFGGRRQRPAVGCGCGDACESRGIARELGRRRCKSSAWPRPRRRQAAVPSPFPRALRKFADLFYPRRGFCCFCEILMGSVSARVRVVASCVYPRDAIFIQTMIGYSNIYLNSYIYIYI